MFVGQVTAITAEAGVIFTLWISQIDFPVSRYGILTAQEVVTRDYVNNHNTVGIHSRGSGWTPMNEFYQLPEAPRPEAEEPAEGEEAEEEQPIIIVKDTPDLVEKQTAFVDSLLLNECGLELAFEGTRFYDIMRFAFRQANPEKFLAEKVAARKGTHVSTRLELL